MTNGVAAFDGIARHDEPRVGRSLLQKLMKKGKRLPISCVGVSEARKRRETEVNCVPDRVRALTPADPLYDVRISSKLIEVPRRLR
jgi:hypothetical protein